MVRGRAPAWILGFLWISSALECVHSSASSHSMQEIISKEHAQDVTTRMNVQGQTQFQPVSKPDAKQQPGPSITSAPKHPRLHPLYLRLVEDKAFLQSMIVGTLATVGILGCFMCLCICKILGKSFGASRSHASTSTNQSGAQDQNPANHRFEYSFLRSALARTK